MFYSLQGIVERYIVGVVRAESARRGVSALRNHTGFWLRSVSNRVTQAFAQKLLDSGVTAEWIVLREMYDGDDLSPSVLADRTEMTRGAASKLIDRLVAKKLVLRRERSDDRRYHIELTSMGRRLLPALATTADRNDEEFFAPLSAEERGALVSTLKKFVHAHGPHKIPKP
jgi:DNA-binding MarR family transcriptional regulator